MTKRDPKKKLIEDQLKEDSGQIRWMAQDTEPPVVYANHVQVLVGPWDFTIRFGQLGFGAGDELGAKEMTRVFVSPPHFKALASLLMRQVTAYEARFGEIMDIAKLAEEDESAAAAASEPGENRADSKPAR